MAAADEHLLELLSSQIRTVPGVVATLIFAIPPSQWTDACSLGVSGDMLVRVKNLILAWNAPLFNDDEDRGALDEPLRLALAIGGMAVGLLGLGAVLRRAVRVLTRSSVTLREICTRVLLRRR